MNKIDPSFLNPRKTKSQRVVELILRENPAEVLEAPVGKARAIRNDPSLPGIYRSTPGLPCDQGQGVPKPEEISPLKDSPLKGVSKKFDLETIPKGEESVKATETPLREPYPSSELTLLPEEDEMNDGWIKLWRKLRQSRVWENPRLLKVWLWCLFRANHKENWVTVRSGRGTTEVKLFPGEFIFGRKTAARELKMKPSSVRNFIAKLRNLKNLDVKQDTQQDTRQDTHYSIISIMNWETYQGTFKKLDTQQKRQLDTQQDRQRTGKGHREECREKKKTLRDSPNPAVKEFFTFWGKAFKEKTGKDYFFNGGKEGNLTKKMLKSNPIDRLRELAGVFFKSQTKFFQDSGYTIGFFYSQINKVVIEAEGVGVSKDYPEHEMIQRLRGGKHDNDSAA